MFKLEEGPDKQKPPETSKTVFSVWEDKGYEDLSVMINPVLSSDEATKMTLGITIKQPTETLENVAENLPRKNGMFSLYLRHKIATQRRTPLALVKRLDLEINKVEQNKVNLRAYKIWQRLTEKMAFKQLLEVLSNFKLVDDEMIRFISDQGSTLLRIAVLYRKSAAPLVFICEHVRVKQFTRDRLGDMLSHDFELELKKQLQTHDYEILRLLLNQYPKLTKLESQQGVDNPALKLLALKLEVLSKIDPKGVAELCGGEIILQGFIANTLNSINRVKLV